VPVVHPKFGAEIQLHFSYAAFSVMLGGSLHIGHTGIFYAILFSDKRFTLSIADEPCPTLLL
jgi:hypothetical protein